MISDISALFLWVKEVFSLQFTLYGFTFSFWEVFLFDTVAGILALVLKEVFLGDG